MKVIGIAQVYNEAINLERFLKYYKEICDDIILLDDASTDNTVEIAKKYTDNVISNKENRWKHQMETFNKDFLLQEAKKMGAEWVVNFDADEIFEAQFNREKLDKAIDWAEFSIKRGIPTYSYGAAWINLWLSEAYFRVDGGLTMVSPPRIYKVLSDAKIETVGGLHRRLWPSYADNPYQLPFNLLHYSSASLPGVIYKITRYYKLGKKFPNIEMAKQHYIYNLLKGTQIAKVPPLWFPNELRPIYSPINLSALHNEISNAIEYMMENEK